MAKFTPAVQELENTFAKRQTGPFVDRGGSVGFDVRAYGAVLDGASDDAAALNAALAAAQEAGVQVVTVAGGAARIASNVTIPSGVTLRVLEGATIKPAAGATLTIKGSFEAGLYKVFDTSAGGTIAFGPGAVLRVLPQWWGAKGDGVTDDTAAIQAAINAANAIGGGIVYFSDGTYQASGVAPRNNVICVGSGGATLRLPAGATGPIVRYFDDTVLRSFHLVDLIFDGNGVAQNLVSIEEPNPIAPDKTWQFSSVVRCVFKNSGAIGLYCQIPGSVVIDGCVFTDNDIGLAWDREHFYLRDTYIGSNRIGVRSTGNHFVATNLVIAHNTEAGWTTDGAGLGLYTSVYESAFVGCTMIDNPLQFGGSYERCRFVGCRIIDGGTGIEEALDCVIADNYFRRNSAWAIDGFGTRTIATGNHFESSAATGGGGIRTKGSGRDFRIADNVFFGFQSAAAIRVVNGNTYAVENNTFVDCAYPIVVETPKTRFRIAANKIAACTVGIHVMTSGSSQVDDWVIVDNEIDGAQQEAILCEIATAFGAIVSRNRIVDANKDNAGHSAMKFATHFIASLMTDNAVRNTTAGLAQYAIEFSTSSGSDTIFDGNVSRNMKAATAYLIPAGFTTGTNIGTIGNS